MGLIQGKSVRFDERYLRVELVDGRVISTPLAWYAPLLNAPVAQLRDYRLICKETGIEWEALDFQLDIESMLSSSVHSSSGVEEH